MAYPTFEETVKLGQTEKVINLIKLDDLNLQEECIDITQDRENFGDLLEGINPIDDNNWVDVVLEF